MARAEMARMSIEVAPKEHRQIKAFAALHGLTLREYVLESIRERLHSEKESVELSALTGDLRHDPVLKDLWDNGKDAVYDKL
jgi:hypothetical protein